MNPEKFESFVTGSLRRIDTLGTTLRQNSKSSNVKFELPLSNDIEDVEYELPSPIRLKHFVPESFLGNSNLQDFKYILRDQSGGNEDVLLADSNHVCTNFNEVQNQLLFYLEDEDEFPSLPLSNSEGDVELTNCDTVDPSTSEMAWRSFRLHSDTNDSSKSHSNSLDEVQTINYSNAGYPHASEHVVATSNATNFLKEEPSEKLFSSYFQLLYDLSKEFDTLCLHLITDTNKRMVLPNIQIICAPIWRYFKRPRYNTI